MKSQSKSIAVVAVCALFAVPADAQQTTTDWISPSNGIWNDLFHWSFGVPDSTKDAKHLRKLNHIQVAGNRACKSFEGAGGSVDRFLLIESTNDLSVGSGGLSESGGIGGFDQFIGPVKLLNFVESRATRFTFRAVVPKKSHLNHLARLPNLRTTQLSDLTSPNRAGDYRIPKLTKESER